MIRSLVTPQTNDLHIALPDNYLGKKVEVLVFTYDEAKEEANMNQDIMAQFLGLIYERTTEELHKHVAKSSADSAIVNRLTLISRNEKDFRMIHNHDLINPWK